jgi:hypothetical protein
VLSRLTVPDHARVSVNNGCDLRTNDRRGIDNVDQAGYKGQMATASVNDLADTILTWLDDNAPRFDGPIRRSWRTTMLEDAFGYNLQTLLLASLDLSSQERLILRLIELLQGPPTVQDLVRVDWRVIRSEDAASSVFGRIQQSLSAVLTDPDLTPGHATELSGQEAAKKITDALQSALSDELTETSESESLVDILRQKPRSDATASAMRRSFQERAEKRRKRARLFLFILGGLIFFVSIYSVLDRHSWFMPSAIFFSWFGYLVLIVTFFAHMRAIREKL